MTTVAAVQPFVALGKENEAPAQSNESKAHLHNGGLWAQLSQLKEKTLPTSTSQISARQPLAPRAEVPNHSTGASVSRATANASTVAPPRSQKHQPPTDEELALKIGTLTLTDAQQQQRARLVRDVRANHESPKQWQSLLSNDAALLQDRKEAATYAHLLSLYSRATALIPRTRPTDPVCCKIWTDYAISQARSGSFEDAKATFQFIWNEEMTQDSYHYYLGCASTDVQLKNFAKAKETLQAGISKKIPHSNLLEKKLQEYTEREEKARAAHASHADAAGHRASTPSVPSISSVSSFSMPAIIVAPVSITSVSSAKSVPSQVLPTPTLSSAAEPVTPLAAGATRRIKLTGVRTELTRTFGKAARVKASDIIIDEDDDDPAPSTPAEHERAMERSMSLPARPVPAPQPGAAPQPPVTTHTTGAALTLAAPSPMGPRTGHHLTSSSAAGSTTYMSTANSSLSTSSTSSSSSSGGGLSPTRTRNRQSVPSFPSTPVAPSTSNSVALLPEVNSTPHAPVPRPVPPVVVAPAPAIAAPLVAAVAPVHIPQPASQVISHTSLLAPSFPAHTPAPLVLQIPQPAPSFSALVAPVAPAPALYAPVSVAQPMPVVAPTPAAPASTPTVKDAFATQLHELLWGAGADPVPHQPIQAPHKDAERAKRELEHAKKELEQQKRQFFALATAMQTNPLGHPGMATVVVVNRKPLIPWAQIGRGGYSVVYKALAADMQFYALKRIDTRKLSPMELSESIENEVQTLRRLREERNIIYLHEDEYDAKHHIWSMLFTMGETDLDTLVKVTAKDNGGMLPENFIRYYWQQMIDAVQTIHNHNIVHTDLKPANFVCVKGVLKLIDFGIAREMQEKPDGEATSVIRHQVVGTVSYMAPETLEHHDFQKVGRASDVWSLGIILYQLVYGAPPFYSLPNQQQRVLALLHRLPIDFKSVKSAALMQIMKACLNHDSTARPTVSNILKCDFLCPPSAELVK